MNEIRTLIKREYKEAVFKKSFIVITLLTPLIMIALGTVPSLLVMMETEEAIRINVVDQTNFVFDRLQTTLNDTLNDGSSRYMLERIETPLNEPQSILDDQKKRIEDEEIDGLLYIPAQVIENDEIFYYAKNVANIDLNRRLKSTVEEIVSNHRIKKSGLDPQIINELTKAVKLKTVKIVKGGEESERGFLEEYFGTFIFVLILYVTLLLYGNAIMRSIVQEKTSRIIEVLLSASNSFQLMSGKILGQGFVGLTQYLIWAVFGVALVIFGGKVLPVSGDFFNFSPMIFVYFVLFYMLGYFLYSTIYAAVGAMTNTDQEAQQVATPIVFLLIIPIMLLGFLVKNPDSTLVVALSLIPFFSPIIMFARINLTTPGTGEILLSIIILILTILFLIWLVSRIYRVGILMYGKRPTLPEIVKWVRYK